MVDYILGNYLVEAGKISKEQLADVLQEQDSVRVKLGLIAVAEGMMTQEEADEVNHLQSVMDKRYGDIAVEKGYLTDDQVSMLLKKQGNVYLMFVQTLMDKQLVTMDEWECILSDFKRKNGLGNTELEDLKSDEPERIIPLLLPAEAASYQGIIGTMVRTMIRLIDRHIYVGHAVMLDDFPAEDLKKEASWIQAKRIICATTDKYGNPTELPADKIDQTWCIYGKTEPHPFALTPLKESEEF